jgi:hypothetical protein
MKVKVSYSEVQEIRELLLAGTRQKVIAKRYGISQQMVSFIGLGRRKSYLSVTDNQSVVKTL